MQAEGLPIRGSISLGGLLPVDTPRQPLAFQSEQGKDLPRIEGA
jgi:hypothetical protein